LCDLFSTALSSATDRLLVRGLVIAMRCFLNRKYALALLCHLGTIPALALPDFAALVYDFLCYAHGGCGQIGRNIVVLAVDSRSR